MGEDENWGQNRSTARPAFGSEYSRLSSQCRLLQGQMGPPFPGGKYLLRHFSRQRRGICQMRHDDADGEHGRDSSRQLGRTRLSTS